MLKSVNRGNALVNAKGRLCGTGAFEQADRFAYISKDDEDRGSVKNSRVNAVRRTGDLVMQMSEDSQLQLR